MKTDILKNGFIILFSFSFSLNAAQVAHEIAKATVLRSIDDFFSNLPNVRLARTRSENDRLRQQHAIWIAQYENKEYKDPRKEQLAQIIVYTGTLDQKLLKEIYEKLTHTDGVALALGLTVDDTPKGGMMIGGLLTPERKTTHIYFVPTQAQATETKK
jgi:hypothetical protein